MDSVVLLADKKSNAWSFAEKIQDYILKEFQVSVPLQNIEIEYFRNKELKMHVPENLRQKDVYFIHDSTLNPQEWWVQLLLVSDLVLNASSRSLSFVLPDMIYSRQDRKDKHHVPISARALAVSISSGLKRIITMDLHAAQLQGFYPKTLPVDNLYSFPEVIRHLKKVHSNDLKNIVVVSPDVGGAERVKYFIKRLEKAQENEVEKKEYAFALIYKTRSKPGEIDKMHLLGEVEGRDVLIVDDIIDSGGTLCKAAELLRANGARKVMCYATHGIFSQGSEKLFDTFNHVMCSNTHTIKNDKLEIIDMAPIFAEAIYRAQRGMSISKLFE